MKLRARALGLAIGVVLGIVVFVSTFISLQVGHGETVGNFAIIMAGYRVSVVGAFVGLVWGFVYGFIGGVAIAWLYNAFHKMLYKG